MTGPLANLPRLTGTRSARASSWDRTGGNDDRLTIAPGATAVLAEIGEPGVVRHIWTTIACREADHLRKIVLRMWWDGEADPSVEVPIGDFFGIGHARTRNFSSLPLQMSPEDGKAFNCWFPMPFESARIEVESQCADDDVLLYFYVDYELVGELEPGLGRFHAQWRRENPTRGISDEGLSNDEYSFGGENTDGAGNYVILEAEGEGHYVGCNVGVQNLRKTGLNNFNWYGEGDDMIFVDGEEFPPSLHGTGTEDYFNTAWCPTQEYNAPYHGLVLPGEQNWWGKVSYYRFHVEDPVRFRRSIRVTIEHGHANRRSDDWSSTAYWYQAEPHAPFPALPAVAERLPRPDEPTP
jgi:hypothetical protein